MPARSVCLLTLFLSEERTWTLRPPSILHRLLPYLLPTAGTWTLELLA